MWSIVSRYYARVIRRDLTNVQTEKQLSEFIRDSKLLTTAEQEIYGEIASQMEVNCAILRVQNEERTRGNDTILKHVFFSTPFNKEQ